MSDDFFSKLLWFLVTGQVAVIVWLVKSHIDLKIDVAKNYVQHTTTSKVFDELQKIRDLVQSQAITLARIEGQRDAEALRPD